MKECPGRGLFSNCISTLGSPAVVLQFATALGDATTTPIPRASRVISLGPAYIRQFPNVRTKNGAVLEMYTVSPGFTIAPLKLIEQSPTTAAVSGPPYGRTCMRAPTPTAKTARETASRR